MTVTVTLSTEATEKTVFEADEADSISDVTVTVETVGMQAKIVSAATDMRAFCCTPA